MGICGENICRLCATESVNSVKIFTEAEDPKSLSHVGQMLMDCILPEVCIFLLIKYIFSVDQKGKTLILHIFWGAEIYTYFLECRDSVSFTA